MGAEMIQHQKRERSHRTGKEVKEFIILQAPCRLMRTHSCDPFTPRSDKSVFLLDDVRVSQLASADKVIFASTDVCVAVLKQSCAALLLSVWGALSHGRTLIHPQTCYVRHEGQPVSHTTSSIAN